MPRLARSRSSTRKRNTSESGLRKRMTWYRLPSVIMMSWVVQPLLDGVLARPPLVEDLDRGVRPGEDLVRGIDAVESAGMRVDQRAALEIQPALLPAGVDDDETGLLLDFQELQQSEQRDAADPAHRLGIEVPLQLIRQHRDVHRFG